VNLQNMAKPTWIVPLRRREHKWLALLLLVAWSVRIALVLRGGQEFFPDEGRYRRAWTMLQDWPQEGSTGTLKTLLGQGDHLGFTMLSSFVAVGHNLVIRATGLPPSPESFRATIWLPALVLSLASVASILMTYSLARRMGAERGEALVAAFLMSCAATMGYYCRHLFPYDASLALALVALWVALAPEPSRRSLAACGLLCCASFLVYNGYWLLNLVVLVVQTAYHVKSRQVATRRAMITGMAFFTPLALLHLTSMVMGARGYLNTLIRFGKTATQGDFAEGWSLPWEYLWSAEHGLLVVWAAGVAAAAWLVAHRSRQSSRHRAPCLHGRCAGPAHLPTLRVGARCGLHVQRVTLWLVLLVAIYALMILFSNGLAKIVVYGRLVRQLVPLLCLITAWTVMQLVVRQPRLKKLAMVGGVLLVFQAGWNLARPFAQRFPDDVLREVTAAYGNVPRDRTIFGPANRPAERLPGASEFVLLNAEFLYPVTEVKPPPAGEVLLRAPHPEQFLPYQYEAFTPEERQRMRSNDISMRLIATGRRTDL
jgi:hypothetical protein